MFIVLKAMVDKYAGRSEVASFLPALDFGLGIYKHSAPNGAWQRESTGVLLNCPATQPLRGRC